MIANPHTPMLRAALAVGGLLAALGTGCASFAPAVEGPGREVRPGAPPEYDVLVFHHHLSEGRMPEALAALERAVAKDDESAYLHRLLGELLARNNELDRAVEHAQQAYELAPEDPDVTGFLAQLYRIQKNRSGAEALLLDEEGAPINADAAFSLYQLYLEQEDFEAALAIGQWMADDDPGELRGWLAVANAHQRMGRPKEAEAALRRSLDVAPSNLRVYGLLARSMRERGDPEGAIAVYREMLAQEPDDHGTLVALAEAQMGDDDLEGAIETFERIEASYPNDLQSVTRLGFLYYEARRTEDAIERFGRVLERSPRQHEVAFFYGVAQRQVGNEKAAEPALAGIPAHHEYYAQARTQLAAIHERHGRYGEALVEIERALEAEPSRQLELYSATLRSKTGDFEGAVAYLENLLRDSPDDDELLYNLGVVYEEGDRTEEAIEFMERALQINPENADALNFIGYVWAERGENLEQAEEYIVRALEVSPDNGFIVDSLGWVYYMRARPLIESGKVVAGRRWLKRALSELERANELTGGDPVISEHLGDAYLLLDQRRRALDKFEEAALMGPRPDEQPHLHEKLETLRREFE
ncbi:MAG: tetratricopeptide repeat protein [Myxococcota bacterium]